MKLDAVRLEIPDPRSDHKCNRKLMQTGIEEAIKHPRSR